MTNAQRSRLEIIHAEQPESPDSLPPENDGYLLDSERVGNFEWWYFDCIDTQSNCMLKIVVHLGTDPLRRRFFPTLALSIKTPDAIQAIELGYQLGDFQAEKGHCDVRLNEDCHIHSDKDHTGQYHIHVNIPEFSASLEFDRCLPVRVPPAHRVKAVKGNRQSELYWNVVQPRAVVNGSFEYDGASYTLQDAVGYHDHNYWQLNSSRGLFIEEVVSRWKWGKCIAGPYTVVFMETGMGGISVKSIMVWDQDKIVYSTDKNLKITVNEEILFKPLKSRYPSRISIKITDDEFPLELFLTCDELIESKDLLKGVNPLIARLIKSFVARPAYYGITASATLETPGQRHVGFGNYEFMLFRA